MAKGKYKLNTASLIGLVVLTFLLFVLRRPELVLHAQPWDEDGELWMAGIHNTGLLLSLFHPQNGHYQTILRLTYEVSMFLGVSYAALGVNRIVILIRCFFLLFPRMMFAYLSYRLAAVANSILMPNQAELFVSITNLSGYIEMFGLLHVRTRTSKVLPQPILIC